MGWWKITGGSPHCCLAETWYPEGSWQLPSSDQDLSSCWKTLIHLLFRFSWTHKANMNSLRRKIISQVPFTVTKSPRKKESRVWQLFYCSVESFNPGKGKFWFQEELLSCAWRDGLSLGSFVAAVCRKVKWALRGVLWIWVFESIFFPSESNGFCYSLLELVIKKIRNEEFPC